jgi:hypothetical protein
MVHILLERRSLVLKIGGAGIVVQRRDGLW